MVVATLIVLDELMILYLHLVLDRKVPKEVILLLIRHPIKNILFNLLAIEVFIVPSHVEIDLFIRAEGVLNSFFLFFLG